MMKLKYLFYALWLVFNVAHVGAQEHPVKSISFAGVPLAYQGRFVPAEEYAEQWVYELSHRKTIPGRPETPALNFLWQLQFKGHQPWDEIPLFWIGRADVKRQLHLDLKQERFSFTRLQAAFANVTESDLNAKGIGDELKRLKNSLAEVASLNEHTLLQEQALQQRWQELQQSNFSNKEIALDLERHFPFATRLQQAGSLFKALPSKYLPGTWYSLQALNVHIYQTQSNTLELAANFTPYSDELFAAIRSDYLNLSKAVMEQDATKMEHWMSQLAITVQQGYDTLAGKSYRSAAGKMLIYPTLGQLAAEQFYTRYPLALICALGYGFSLLLWGINYASRSPVISKLAMLILLLTFALHTAILALRCYILGRPPVSNMFETLLYVPWVALFSSLCLNFFMRQTFLLYAASVASFFLLLLLQVSQQGHAFDNVQAVLDSQYWLIVHVLMVVASYALFILSGILGHIYLIESQFKRQSDSTNLGAAILQTMYLGVALLVPGTLLGGVWAAQSWGRFWDWDPKEAWAFISIAIYLLWIHAYRFNYIGYFGLAAGAVVGMLAISFTWYGVNYILGTGLHSYGFGQGGEGYYYSYLLAEISFLATIFAIAGKFKKITC